MDLNYIRHRGGVIIVAVFPPGRASRQEGSMSYRIREAERHRALPGIVSDIDVASA